MVENRNIPKIFFLLLVCICVTVADLYAQPSLRKMKDSLRSKKNLPQNDYFKFNIHASQPNQGSILFNKKSKLKQAEVKAWLAEKLDLRKDKDELVKDKDTKCKDNFNVEKMRQYYKGIKVEHGVINSTSKDGTASFLQMEFYSIKDDVPTKPVLSESEALKKAMNHTGAKSFMWQQEKQNKDSDYEIPKGELCIVEDMRTPGKMCLCYKFNIYAIEPVSRAWIYVNAINGEVILVDNIIKHLHDEKFYPKVSVNAVQPLQTGPGHTLYSGTRTIQSTLILGKYILYNFQNGHDISTQNYLHLKAGKNDASAVEFTSTNGNWTTGTYNDTTGSNRVALDAHYNMSIISNYWLTKHQRNSWDNNGGTLTNYVHANDPKTGAAWNNAFWNGKGMYYGDGDGVKNRPFVPLDISAHELGHAICQNTAGLVYRWESGALNEGLSDIWGVCVDSFALVNNLVARGKKNVWWMGEEIALNHPNLRNIEDPHHSRNPAPEIYKEPGYWIPASYEEVPIPDEANDYGGVHYNSSILGRWFNLLVTGGGGVTPITLSKAEDVVYLTEQNLTPNSTYATCKTVSINASMTKYPGDPSVEQAVRDAWAAMDVGDNFFDIDNTQDFATNEFTSIAIGAGNEIWAGTSGAGLYKYNGTLWERAPILSNYDIKQILSDTAGGIWVAQAGHEGLKCTGGGVNHFTDNTFGSNVFYSASSGLPSRHTRGIFIDTIYYGQQVWVGSSANINTILQNGEPVTQIAGGGVGIGLNPSAPFFTKTTKGLDSLYTDSLQYVVKCIGGNYDEVWAFTDVNNKSKIVRYDKTRQLVTPSHIYDKDNTSGVLSEGFEVTAIHFDRFGNKWLGLQSGGIVVLCKSDGKWKSINFPEILIPGAAVNQNAINSDRFGNVYIGTDKGLIFSSKYGALLLEKKQYFKLITTANGLQADNIKGIDFDTLRNKVLLATDKGIIFFDPICMIDCSAKTPLGDVAFSLDDGEWSDPSIWSNNSVPNANTEVTVYNNIMVDVNTECKTLNVYGPGRVEVKSGVTFKILFENEVIEQD